jgi:oligopeptide transport system permease protein
MTEAADKKLERGTSLWRDAGKRLRKNVAAMVGAGVVGFMGLTALGYEVIAANLTGFTMEEQHAFIVPKPPGARSVPAVHYSLLPDSGPSGFEALDVDKDGGLTAAEVYEGYRRLEFIAIDRDRDGALSYREYEAAPLTLPSPSSFIPNCRKWATLKRSLAPIEHPDVFACDAKGGKLAYADTGKVLDVVTSSEAADIVTRLDKDKDGKIGREEFVGLPAPKINLFGTDQLGRDLLTRMVFGARISLAVGLIATLVSFLIGVTWGATAGFVGGKVDGIMMRMVDVLYGLPFMFLVILLMVVFGQNIILLFVALGAIQWLTMARIVRGQVISLKSREFVEAARCIGVSGPGIIFRHLIPNALGPIIVYSTLTVPAVMLEEAFLSFLGLGVQAPMTSWGALVSEGRQMMDTAPWLIIFPGAALAVTLLSLNFLGDGLRDALDPQLRKD